MRPDMRPEQIATYHKGFVLVSTIKCQDTVLPYETAVSHPDFNDDKLIIVGSYSTIGEALAGHEKWIKVMTTEPLPEFLRDVGTFFAAMIVDLLNEMDPFDSEDDWRMHYRKGVQRH